MPTSEPPDYEKAIASGHAWRSLSREAINIQMHPSNVGQPSSEMQAPVSDGIFNLEKSIQSTRKCLADIRGMRASILDLKAQVTRSLISEGSRFIGSSTTPVTAHIHKSDLAHIDALISNSIANVLGGVNYIAEVMVNKFTSLECEIQRFRTQLAETQGAISNLSRPLRDVMVSHSETKCMILALNHRLEEACRGSELSKEDAPDSSNDKPSQITSLSRKSAIIRRGPANTNVGPSLRAKAASTSEQDLSRNNVQASITGA